MGKIMIVDDEPDFLWMLEKLIGKKGYEVIKKSNAMDCLEYLEKEDEKPDLILIDMLMPEMDGWEACRRIKEKKVFSSIPVVIHSAHNEIGNLTQESRCDGHFRKPFEMEEFYSMLDRYMEK